MLRRLAIAAFAAAAAIAGSIATPAVAAPDIYTTPGGQVANARLWNTNCSPYSETVFRCRTNIWASQVVLKGGKYQHVTGWVFNNLTYLPSARKAWAKNPLGKPGTFTSAGRKWKTECDTPATGRGACRSYIWTDVVSLKGGVAFAKPGWVFNNIVRFAEGGVKPVTKVPAHLLDQVRLTPTGLGPLQVGSSLTDLERLGYVKGTDSCTLDQSPALTARGIWVHSPYQVTQINVGKPGVRTAAGAQVGMTFDQLRKLYGSQLEPVYSFDNEVDHFGARWRLGQYAIFFFGEDVSVPVTTSTRVDRMIAARASEPLIGFFNC